MCILAMDQRILDAVIVLLAVPVVTVAEFRSLQIPTVLVYLLGE
jgi:hypothetical protein